ncbi:MAG: hypothetical protein IJ112_04440 [Oscillospiraceae bacterium]|nr:hypothetical protein [Oscillospiraceae bacterium]
MLYQAVTSTKAAMKRTHGNACYNDAALAQMQTQFERTDRVIECYAVDQKYWQEGFTHAE